MNIKPDSSRAINPVITTYGFIRSLRRTKALNHIDHIHAMLCKSLTLANLKRNASHTAITNLRNGVPRAISASRIGVVHRRYRSDKRLLLTNGRHVSFSCTRSIIVSI